MLEHEAWHRCWQAAAAHLCPHLRTQSVLFFTCLSLWCSGAELIVPHDGEPGPTQRYSELYFKALETVSCLMLNGCVYCHTAVQRAVQCT